MAQHAEPLAARAVPVEERRIARRDIAGRSRRRRIVGIDAGDDIEQRGEIRDAARHRSRRVARIVEPDHAGARDQRPAWPQTHQRVVRGGIANRSPRVGAEADDTEARGEAGAGAARGAAGGVSGVVGIAREAGQDRVDIVEAAARPFGHRCFCQNDRAGIAQLARGGRILLRHPAGQRRGAAGRLQAGDVVIVFHQHRDAVQRPSQHAGLPPMHVERGGVGECLRIGHDDRAERRAFAVIRSDAIEMRLDHGLRRHGPSAIGGMNCRDRRFLDHKGRNRVARHRTPTASIPLAPS